MTPVAAAIVEAVLRRLHAYTTTVTGGTWTEASVRPIQRASDEHIMYEDVAVLLGTFVVDHMETIQMALDHRDILLQPEHGALVRACRERAWTLHCRLRARLLGGTPDDRVHWSSPQRLALMSTFLVLLGWQWLDTMATSSREQRQSPLEWPLVDFEYVEAIVRDTDFVLVVNTAPLKEYALSHWTCVHTMLVDKCIPRAGWHPRLYEFWSALWSWFATVAWNLHPGRERDDRVHGATQHATSAAMANVQSAVLAKLAKLGLGRAPGAGGSGGGSDGPTTMSRLSGILDVPEVTVRRDAPFDPLRHTPIVYGNARMTSSFLLEMESTYFAHATAFHAIDAYETFLADEHNVHSNINRRLNLVLAQAFSELESAASDAWHRFLDQTRASDSATMDQSIRNGVFSTLGRAYLNMGESERYFVVRHELNLANSTLASRQIVRSKGLNPERLIAERRPADYTSVRQFKATAAQMYTHVLQNFVDVDSKRLPRRRQPRQDDDDDGGDGPAPLSIGHDHEHAGVLLLSEALQAQLARARWPAACNVHATSWIEEYVQESARLPACPPPPHSLLEERGRSGQCVVVRFMRRHYVIFRIHPTGPFFVHVSPNFASALLTWIALSRVDATQTAPIESLPSLGTIVVNFRRQFLQILGGVGPAALSEFTQT